MAKKTLKELRKPKVATMVLEIRTKDGSPIRQKDKLRLRKSMRQFLRSANQLREPSNG